MKTIIPNYKDLGFADHMGPKLRDHVERQLAYDLKNYKVDKNNLKFDWSDSCVEGHRTKYLDGSVENFSGIAVFGNNDSFVADGWMEFIHDNDFFLAYWEFVTTWDKEKKLKDKKEIGIPGHIWRQIPDDLKPKYKDKRIKK
ncbi:hypothetical protein JYT72_00895 [Crocinitomix catalasitica]|nr:hypothetical protein [Crocinitomix catalasitica]